MSDDHGARPAGAPVGRRTILGVVGLGVAGVLGGNWAQNSLARLLGPLEYRDPTGLIALFPLGDAFRFYSVTGSVPTRTDGRLPARCVRPGRAPDVLFIC